MKKLTAREEAFCQNYVISNNGSDAARKAGYSELNANRIATRLLSNVHIQDRLTELRKPLQEKLEVNKEYVIGGFKKIADLFLAEGNEKQAMTANKALDNLAKHLGLYEKDNEQKKTEIVIKRQ